MQSTFIGVPDAPVIALAVLKLKRMRMTSLPVATRAQAIRILQGLKPAPPRKSKAFKPRYALCNVCYGPLLTGTLCDSMGKRHINCEPRS